MNNPAIPVVKVLCEGFLVREGSRVLDASSTVTLVSGSGGDILVDTGAAHHRDDLLSALDTLGLSPSSVGAVVNTHLHVDHCGNNDLFGRARFYAHRSEKPPIGTVRVDEKTPLGPGVSLVPTPGHTEGSVTVFVESDLRYAICGDAIPAKANHDSRAPPAVNIDPGLALASLDLISSWAQVVVPGHGPPFKTIGKK
jgi:N-acyl homoserine lactone hydrolase